MSSRPILTYLQSGGRAEAIRLVFAVGGVPFDDRRITLEQFLAQQTDHSVYPTEQLPVLEIAGKKYTQAMSIIRYAGKLGGLYPFDPTEALVVDESLDHIFEMYAAEGQFSRSARANSLNALQLQQAAAAATPRYPQQLAPQQLQQPTGTAFAPCPGGSPPGNSQTGSPHSRPDTSFVNMNNHQQPQQPTGVAFNAAGDPHPHDDSTAATAGGTPTSSSPAMFGASSDVHPVQVAASKAVTQNHTANTSTHATASTAGTVATSRSPVMQGGIGTRSPGPDEDWEKKVKLCFRRLVALIRNNSSPFLAGNRASIADFALFVLVRQITRGDLPHVPAKLLQDPEFAMLFDLVDILEDYPGVSYFFDAN